MLPSVTKGSSVNITAAVAGPFSRAELDSTNVKLAILTYAQSKKYCQSFGEHLATIREGLEHATKYGSAIRETAYPNQSIGTAIRDETAKNLADGFQAIMKSSPTGVIMFDFYFKQHEYADANDFIRGDIGSLTSTVIFSTFAQTDEAYF